MAPLKICGHMAYQEFKIKFQTSIGIPGKITAKEIEGKWEKQCFCEIVFAERFKGWNSLGFL